MKYRCIIVNSATGKAIPEDEPVFIIRGRDRYAAAALRAYASIVDGGTGTPFSCAIRELADEIDWWQKDNPYRVKTPD